MNKIADKYADGKGNFANVVIEITSTGQVRIKNWPKYNVDSAEVIDFLRNLANNIENIKGGV